MINCQNHWWPILRLSELPPGKAVSRVLDGVPLVIFKDKLGQPAILHDRCPHRHAPLSCGKIVDGDIECPYHGWRFASSGNCTAIPGRGVIASSKPLVTSFPTQIVQELLWVCLERNSSTPEPVLPSVIEHTDSFYMSTTVNCTIQQAAENFLDGFHTHFVHAGWIRRDQKRQRVKVSVHHLPNGIEARYSGEELQSGFISSLLEGDRQLSMGRFLLPGVAEIEYRGKRGLNLLVTAWLVPEASNKLRIYACVATRKGVLPAWLKRYFLYWLFSVILKQDKAILEQVSANIERFRAAPLEKPILNSTFDFLAPSISQLLAGEKLSIKDGWETSCQL